MAKFVRFLFACLALSFCSFVIADCELLDEPRSESITSEEIDEQLLKYERCLADALDSVAGVRVRFGLTHKDRNQHKEAIAQYTKALEINPEHIDAYTNRSLSYSALKEFSLALRDLDAAIDIAPNDIMVRYYKGITFVKMKRYAEAIEIFEAAQPLSTDPKQLARLLYQKGLAYKYLKRPDEALASFNEAITQDLEFPEAYFSRALNSQQEDKWDEALADYTRVIELQPDNAAAYYNRGIVYQKLDKDPLAVRDYTEAIKINPVYMKARVRKGMSYLVPLFPVILVLLLG